MSVAGLILRRSGAGVLTLLALSVLIFLATEVLPGDTVGAVAGSRADPARREAVRVALGLDRPAFERYFSWIGGVLQGDLGRTLVGGAPVSQVIADRLPASLLLALCAYVIMVPLGVVLGAAAGWSAAPRPAGVAGQVAQGTGRRGWRRSSRLDVTVSTVGLVTLGIPEFVVATVLAAVLGIGLGLVPTVSVVATGSEPWESPEVLVLPVLTVAVPGTAVVMRLVRASVLEVVRSPYVEAARLRGVRGARLLTRHVLPNALGPTVAALTSSLGGVVSGAIVAETIFAYPGIGSELQRAVTIVDLPLIQGLTLAVCALALVSILAGDLLARALDPAARGLW